MMHSAFIFDVICLLLPPLFLSAILSVLPPDLYHPEAPRLSCLENMCYYMLPEHTHTPDKAAMSGVTHVNNVARAAAAAAVALQCRED